MFERRVEKCRMYGASAMCAIEKLRRNMQHVRDQKRVLASVNDGDRRTECTIECVRHVEMFGMYAWSTGANACTRQ